ncbi:MAG: hypothetical protein WBP89_05375 [Sedimenticolaceae bacterium]
MNDQQQHHDPLTEDRADRQVAKTPAQLLFQPDTGKQGLINHETRERGQSLVFELELGDTMSFAVNSGFATLHANGLRWFYWFVSQLQFYQRRDRFFMCENGRFALSSPHYGLHHGCNPQTPI